MSNWINWANWLSRESARSTWFRTARGTIATQIKRSGPKSGVLEISFKNRSIVPIKYDLAAITTTPNVSWKESFPQQVIVPRRPNKRSAKQPSEVVIKLSFRVDAPSEVEFQIPFGNQILSVQGFQETAVPLPFEDYTFDTTCNLIIPDFSKINAELLRYLARNPEALHDLTPRGFEELLDAIFRNQGYRSELGPGWNDGGVDIRLYQRDSIGEVLTLVQARRYGERYPIRLEAVAALSAIVDDEGANRGLFVTTSRFLPQAERFAERSSRRLLLADSRDVAMWCRELSNGGPR